MKYQNPVADLEFHVAPNPPRAESFKNQKMRNKVTERRGLLNNSIKVVHRRQYAVEVCDARLNGRVGKERRHGKTQAGYINK